MMLDRNEARGQMPWTFRRRMIIASMAASLALFALALMLDRADAYVAIAGFAGAVAATYIGAAVMEDIKSQEG